MQMQQTLKCVDPKLQDRTKEHLIHVRPDFYELLIKPFQLQDVKNHYQCLDRPQKMKHNNKQKITNITSDGLRKQPMKGTNQQEGSSLNLLQSSLKILPT